MATRLSSVPEVPTTRRTPCLRNSAEHRIELVGEMRLERFDLRPRSGGSAAEEALAQAGDADLVALQRHRLAALDEDELDAAAADVDDQRRLAAQVDGVAHAEVDEARFLAAGDDLDAQADVVLDLLDEVAAVGGLAHGAGRDGGDAGHALALGQGAEGGQRAHAGVDRLRRQAPLAERAAAEPHHFLGAVEHAEAAVRLHLGHDHVDGVAADVDSCDSHVRACSHLHRPTTSPATTATASTKPRRPTGRVIACATPA